MNKRKLFALGLVLFFANFVSVTASTSNAVLIQLSVSEGTTESGDLSSLLESDDDSLIIKPNVSYLKPSSENYYYFRESNGEKTQYPMDLYENDLFTDTTIKRNISDYYLPVTDNDILEFQINQTAKLPHYRPIMTDPNVSVTFDNFERESLPQLYLDQLADPRHFDNPMYHTLNTTTDGSGIITFRYFSPNTTLETSNDYMFLINLDTTSLEHNVVLTISAYGEFFHPIDNPGDVVKIWETIEPSSESNRQYFIDKDNTYDVGIQLQFPNGYGWDNQSVCNVSCLSVVPVQSYVRSASIKSLNVFDGSKMETLTNIPLVPKRNRTNFNYSTGIRLDRSYVLNGSYIKSALDVGKSIYIPNQELSFQIDYIDDLTTYLANEQFQSSLVGNVIPYREKTTLDITAEIRNATQIKISEGTPFPENTTISVFNENPLYPAKSYIESNNTYTLSFDNPTNVSKLMFEYESDLINPEYEYYQTEDHETIEIESISLTIAIKSKTGELKKMTIANTILIFLFAFALGVGIVVYLYKRSKKKDKKNQYTQKFP